MSDSLLLVLNAAEGRLQFLLARLDGEGGPPLLLAAQDWHAPSQGAELLTPALSHTLERLRLSPRQISRIACVRGPGSFTGLRLALSTAAGLSRATGAAQAGLDYLPLLAEQAARLYAPTRFLRERTLWVCTHARRNLVHVQGFSVDETTAGESRDALSLAPPAVLPVQPEAEGAASLAPYIHEHGAGDPVFVGSGRTRNYDAVRELFPDAVQLPGTLDHPSPAALLHAAHHAMYSTSDIAPLYIRASDAEENLPRIAEKLGLDPREAEQRLQELTHAFMPQRQ